MAPVLGHGRPAAPTAGRRLGLRRIIWTDEAVTNLAAVVDYTAMFNPAAAAKLAERLVALADSLTDFSERGRDVGDGRREMTTVWPYILRYRVRDDAVVILRIRHGAREPEDE